MGPHYVRAQMLCAQKKYDLAEQELRLALAEDPDDGHSHALLGMCLSELKRFDEATAEARAAIHEEPDNSFCHYALASVCVDRNQFKEALAAVQEAIRLDPEDADFYSLLAAVHLEMERWPEALKATEEGLRVDPEHVRCTNLRAIALVKLGRNEEAGQTIDAALNKDPDNAVTHANRGWALMHAGKHREAMEHFREALRLNPELDWARHGIVEALKSRVFIYAWMLRYLLWMSRLSPRTRWVIVIGGYLAFRFLAKISDDYPAMAPWLNPLIYGYIVFALFSWTSAPLFNLMLRIDRFGRYALSRDQRVGSNWIGLLVLGALATLAWWAVTGNEAGWVPALIFALLMIPISATYVCQIGWPRVVMGVVSVALSAVGLFLSCAIVFEPEVEIVVRIFGALFQPFFIAVLVVSFAANALISVRPTR